MYAENAYVPRWTVVEQCRTQLSRRNNGKVSVPFGTSFGSLPFGCLVRIRRLKAVHNLTHPAKVDKPKEAIENNNGKSDEL